MNKIFVIRPSHVLATSALIFILLSTLPLAHAQDLSNPITAAPPVSLPTTTHCTVTLVYNQPFGLVGGPRGDAPFLGSYTPPSSCPAPWSKIVLQVNFNVTAGRQYDRLGAIWLGNAEIFRTSTAEPYKTFGPVWQVQKDVSQYWYILTEPQTVVAVVTNYVTPTYTSIIYMTATLTFYATASGVPAAQHPDLVVPVARMATSTSAPWFYVTTTTPKAGVTLTLPTNLVKAYLEVYATAHSMDEFWYANQPTPYAVANGLAGGTAFREVQVYIDGILAGVVWPFPFIYTGGINPYLWRPIPAVDAFNIPAYTVDLTPFLGVLLDGQPHTIAFSVFNNYNYWLIDCNLLLYEDPVLTTTSGALVTDNIQPTATEQVIQIINKKSAVFNTTASRTTTVSGYVDTSSGRVTTTIQQSMYFTNNQALNLVNYLENLKGTETITTTTTTVFSYGTTIITTVSDSYPIAVTSAFIIPVGTGDEVGYILPATVHQELDRTTSTSTNSLITFSSSLSDSIDARALYAVASHIARNGETTESYIYTDSTGVYFNHLLQAAQGVVTVDILKS